MGIFGLTTAETKEISSRKCCIRKLYRGSQKAVKAFEDKGVNKIIALTHIGYDDNPAYDNDLILAKSVDGIDIVVGGHSHTQLDKPTVVNQNTTGQAKDPTVIVQAYQYNDYLGTLDVTFNQKGVVVEHNGALLKVANYAEDAQAVELLKPFKQKVEEVSKKEIGAEALGVLENPRGDISVRKMKHL